MRSRVLASIAGAVLVVVVSTFACAENGTELKVVDKPAPDDVAADIKDAVVPKAYQISAADGVFFEFWFVPGLKASAFGATTKETLDKIESISLLGIAIVSSDAHHDFRDDPIDPGTYIMRLALQPKDGNHMGTAPFDTFAILVPLALDPQLKEFRDHETMVELASENTVAEHPPIFSLQPFDDAGGETPRLQFNEEEEWNFLMLQFPVEAAGETKTLAFGLVVEGIGEL
jgi:hypothetical protein